MKWDNYYFPQEVLQQSEAVRNCTAALKNNIASLAERYPKVNRVHIIGSGDCYFISTAAAHAFRRQAGIPAEGYEAYDYFLEKPISDENTLVILFSSSGKSLYVLKSLKYANSQGAVTVGVTNHADSPLGSDSRETLLTDSIGVSYTFPTKTTTSSLALLYLLAYAYEKQRRTGRAGDAVMLTTEMEQTVPAIIDRIYDVEIPNIQKLAQSFLDARCYTYVGSDICRSAAMVGAAKIVETSRGHVTFCNAEEYMHLHGFSVRSSDAVVVIGNNVSDHRERQVVEYANDQRARILVVGNVSTDISGDNVFQIAPYLKELSVWGNSICVMVVLQLFACQLSRLSFRDPDAPHDVNLKKVIELLYTGPVAGWNVE